MIAIRDREKRRKQALIDQQQQLKEREDLRRQEIMLEQLQKQSQEERKIAAALLQVKEQKEVMRQNRILRYSFPYKALMFHREAEYVERRRREFERALERDAEIARRNRAEYEKRLQIERERFRKYEEERMRQKREKHTAKCKRLTLDVVDLALKVVDYKLLTDGEEPPPKDYAEWKLLFLSGLPLFPRDEDLETSQEEELLNEHELTQYLNAEGDWSFGNDHKEAGDTILSETMQHLISIAEPAGAKEQQQIPEYPFKIAILGKPFSGKTTQAQKLSQKFGVAIISPERVIDDAVAKIQNNESFTSAEAQQLAAAASKSLKEGKAIEDRILVGLIHQEIKSLEGQNEQRGWILDGFPRTSMQAQLLEKELSGFEPPKKRRGKRGYPRIVSTPSKQDVKESPKSAIDCVIQLELLEEIAMKRSLGRRIDPETRIVYHLEFNPPPADQHLINSRLQTPEGSEQLQQALLEYNENKKSMEEWFSQFGNLVTKDADTTIESLFNNLSALCTEIIQKKTEEMEQKKKEEELRRQEEAEAAERQEQERKQREEEARKAEKQLLQKNEEEKKTGRRSAKRKKRGEENLQEGKKEDTKDDSGEKVATETQKLEESEENAQGTTSEQELKRESQDLAPVLEPEKPPSFPVDLAVMLVEKWKKLESHYLKGAKRVFQTIRKEKKAIIEYSAKIRNEFLVFLNRPDDFQEAITQFENSWREIDPNMLDQDETKQELHQRADDLMELLWAKSDKRKYEAEEERRRIIRIGWTTEHSTLILNAFITLMQLEIDRYLESRQLLTDYFQAIQKQPIEENLRSVDLPFLGSSLKFRPPSSKGKKKKIVSSRPRKDDQLNELSTAYERALSLLPQEDRDRKKAVESEEISHQSDLQKGLEQEDIIFQKRLLRIKERGLNLLQKIKEQTDETYAKMDDWIGERFRMEVNNTENLINYVKETIEAEKPVPHLEVASSKLIIVESDRQMDKDLATIDLGKSTEKLSLTSGRFRDNLSQFAALAKKLDLAAPEGLISTTNLVALLLNEVGTANEFGSESTCLPPEWITYDVDMFARLVDQFAKKSDKEEFFVDWIEFLISFWPNEIVSLEYFSGEMDLPARLKSHPSKRSFCNSHQPDFALKLKDQPQDPQSPTDDNKEIAPK